MPDDKDNVTRLKVVPKPPPKPLPQPRGEKRETCEFFMLENDGMTDGIYRRFPPAQMLVQVNPSRPEEVSIHWHFPLMKAAGWCGEWKLRNHEPEQAAQS